jgi:glutathione synthase/RimK-type ligase-like ATP-grasp enzyme
VGIFGAPDDQEVRALAKRLADRGAEPWIVDLAAFPHTLRLAWRNGFLLLDGRDTREMASAYLRIVGRNLPAHAQYGEAGATTTDETWTGLYASTVAAFRRERANQALRNALLQKISRRCKVINPPVPQNLHRQKPLLFSRLARAGIPVPPFLATSDSRAAATFAQRAASDWIGAVDKPCAGIYKTLLWDSRRAPEHRWGTRPALVQRYIRGDTIRCYVLRFQAITAARIVHGGTVDSSMSQTGIELVQLTEVQRGIAERTARALDLAFCGMDLMVDSSSGTTWVIDCNLSPMFVNFARLTLVDLPGLLADYLIELATGEQARQRPAVLDLVEDAKRMLAVQPHLRAWPPKPGGDKP